jgi:threonine/homoserine/homoserine lactone efflux protein
MTFLPDLTKLAAFTLASIVLWLSQTINHGRNAGLASIAGTNLGCVIHTVLVAFGLSLLIAASPTGFLLLKIVGAAYLLWLAVDAIRKGSSLNVSNSDAKSMSLLKSFMLGIGINLTNPKVVLFFIMFLPQFVSAGDPHVTGKLLFLGLYFVVINTPLAALMIFGAEKLVVWLKKKPRVMRGIDFTFAGVFAIFALKIAFTQGRS